MKKIEGGVCAAKGFKANGIHCGIRHNRTKRDLCMIVSDVPAKAAAVYTQNLVKGAPIAVTKRNIANGIAQAVICNSGNANTCNADGELVAEKMCGLVEAATGIAATDVVVCSTGVIGQPLNLEPIAKGMDALVAGLDYTQEAGTFAAEAIMTTDTVKKEVAVEFTLGGKVCRMGGIAKGSGMIHPNLATMLVFITTDAAISAQMLQKALRTDVQATFNMLSIDGDTSTNDTVAVLANGLAGNEEITAEGEDFTTFMEALNSLTVELSRRIVADGEVVGGLRVVDPGDGSRKRISPLFILPRHRGKGYAQRAILEAEKRHGAHHWELGTILQEPGNCYLYEKMGYHQTDRRTVLSDILTIIGYEKD